MQTSSKYLGKSENSHCLILDTNLAGHFDYAEASVISLINYWVQKYSANPDDKTHRIDGRVWVYNSCEEWQRQIGF